MRLAYAEICLGGSASGTPLAYAEICLGGSASGTPLAYLEREINISPNVRRRLRIAYVADVVVVDVANVMGARADGWWRDRAGAALRLCREVAALARRGDEAGRWVLVLEGRAREAATAFADENGNAAVSVLPAPGSGDDAIVGVVAEAASRAEGCLVVTADRELRQRCEERGAAVTGPGWLLRQL